MFWTILFYLFLILVFLVFLRFSTLKINGKKIISFPMRIVLSLLFPLILILVALFGSLMFLFIMALLLIAFLVFLLLFFIGRIRVLYKKENIDDKNRVVIHSVKKNN